jgi:hypothetical protein
MNKKNPCVVESKIKEMIDTAVKEKLVEIKKSKPIEFEIIDEDDIIYDNKLVKDINHKKITIPKPILKWVGGKTQILDKLIVEFPRNINNYREIFLGGGSVLLTLLSYVKNGIIKIQGNIYAYDLNEPFEPSTFCIFFSKIFITILPDLYSIMYASSGYLNKSILYLFFI